MRVNLARAILEKRELIVFDEYTSTVNREVAKFGSYALQKAIRRLGKKFIAVTCHYDVIEWLEPDWVFDTADMRNVKKNSRDREYQLRSIRFTGLCGEYFGSITI